MGALKRYNETTQQWEYITNDPGQSSIISSEEMSGTINGTNSTFTTSASFYSIDVYKNGVHMRPGATNDYTITGPNQITFNAGNIPLIGSTVTASYVTSQGIQTPAPSVLTTPVGVISAYAGATAPTGYLLCDGMSYGNEEYPALYAIIGLTYGGFPGAFTVPNLQQRFPLGKAFTGTGSTLGETGGSIDHTHTLDNGYAALTMGGFIYQRDKSTSHAAGYNRRTNVSINAIDSSGSLASTTQLGGTTDSSNPPYQVVNYIIKAV